MSGLLPVARHGLLGRFDAPVEDEYRAWFVQRYRPLGAALSMASVVAWFVIAPFTHFFLSSDNVPLVYVVCWGINIPALVAAMLYLRRPVPTLAVDLGVGLLLLTAIGTIAVIMPTLSGLETSTYALAATFYGLVAPVSQMPFRRTVPVAALMAALGAAGMVLADGGTSETFALAMAFTVIAMLFIGPAMSFAIERDLRSQFLAGKTIAHQQTLIRRYAPSSVVSRIEHGDSTVDQPQRRKITVFFSDVVGFTALADRVDPEALAEIVNDYLGALSELIERHNGTLNEFAGDGVMALFGAPEELDPAEQVRAALAAAQELQRSLPVWSQSWFEHGILEEARARVGINTGTVSVGTFGSKIRATYTGIGLQTNIAARVQAEAPPGGILLSNTSWHLVKDTVDCEPRGEVMVKGVHFPIGLYAPV